GGPDDEQYEALSRLGEAAAGKPVTVAAGLEAVSMPALMRAALHTDYAIAVPLALGADGFADLQRHLQDVREELLAEEADFLDVRVAGTTDLQAALPDPLADYLIGRVIAEGHAVAALSGGSDSGPGLARGLFDSLAAEAAALLLPVEVGLAEASEAAVHAA